MGLPDINGKLYPPMVGGAVIMPELFPDIP